MWRISNNVIVLTNKSFLLVVSKDKNQDFESFSTSETRIASGGHDFLPHQNNMMYYCRGPHKHHVCKVWFQFRVRDLCQSCQTWPAKFGQILPRTDTSLVFCNRKLMRTDILFTRTTKPTCNFVNPANWSSSFRGDDEYIIY